MTTVNVKPVLKLIKYHAEGNFEEAKKAALEIAEELDGVDDGQITEYILAQYNLIPTWVAQ